MARKTTELDFITPTVLAKELGVSRRTLDKWHRLRIAPARVQITARVVGYRRASVDAWLVSREQAPAR